MNINTRLDPCLPDFAPVFLLEISQSFIVSYTDKNILEFSSSSSFILGC